MTTGLVVVAGEVTTEAYVEIPKIVRQRIINIGYDSSTKGFDGGSCGVSIAIGQQSPDIAQGVDTAVESRSGESIDALDAQGAGDQGLMFGYACSDTTALMPLPIDLAHRLAEQLAEVRKDGTMPYLRPDGKTQVTIEYDGDRPVRIDTVVLSSQHAADIDLDALLAPDARKHVVDPVLERYEIDSSDYRLLVNPTGRFEIGGPMGDAGLTGRKIIVDTYGGMSRHGGGAFSGKDPSKVDRSAAYAMRWVAKNVVAAGLAGRCEVQVAYAIGKAHPVGFYVETFGTEQVPVAQIQDAVLRGLRPAAGGDHPRPRPQAAHLRPDGGVRTLRPRSPRHHLGEHRPGRRAGRGRPRLSRRGPTDNSREKDSGRCRKRGRPVRREGVSHHNHNGRTVMKVMVMIEGSGADEDKITPTEEMFREMGAYNEQLVQAGIMLDGQGLHPSSKGARVVFEGGSTTVVDGPFTESKEIIAGYWLWEVSSLEEAVEWAKRCPTDPQYGARQVLEVRPIFSAEDFGAEYTEDLAAQDARLAEEIKARHGATKKPLRPAEVGRSRCATSVAPSKPSGGWTDRA